MAHAMQNKAIPLFVSVDPALGSFDQSPGFDRFTLQFKNTIIFPPQAQNITLELNQASIWWTANNIQTGVNDAFRLLVGGVATDIVIPAGLYDVSALNSAVDRELVNAGLSSGLVTLTGDAPTGKVLVTLTPTGPTLQVEWVATSFFALVGFTSGQFVPVAPTAVTASELGPNVANFSDISSFLVHTDLVQGGIPLGNREEQVIADVQINVPPGSLINFAPNNPVVLNVDHLRGQHINQASFWVSDQRGAIVDFNGEYFSLLIVIRYYLDEHDVSHV